MKGSELLNLLFEVEHPWRVANVSYDAGTHRIDVWMAEQPERSGWFLRAKADGARGPDRVWRHLNVGSWRCYVHVPVASCRNSATLPWCGDEDMPFTGAMSREVVRLLMEGLKFPAVCKLLDVQLGDLWKFKHGLDRGRTGLSGVQARPAAPRADEADAAHPASRLPELASPVWERLLDGSLDIDIRVLSLKLLLTKLREHMHAIDDAEVRQLKIHEMYRYCSRHEHVLGHELAQLRLS